MESDDEFETGLPKVPDEACSVGNVNLQEVLRGEPQEFHFDMPDKLETIGYMGMGMRKPVESSLHPSNVKQMELKFSDLNVEEVVKVMFGDYSEVREVINDKITEDGGVMKRLLRPGTGKKVTLKNMVRVHYMVGAELMDDIIESTYEANCPRRFRVGAGEMIPAMDLGLATMRVGEISKFLATYKYAYGKLGVPLPGKIIPAEVSVMLQIEVLEAYDAQKNNSVTHMSSAERRLLPFDEIFAYAEGMKHDGNREFKTEDYHVAVTYYLGALDCIKDMEPMTKEEKTKYLRLRQQVCNNLAHSHFKLKQFKRALTYAEAGAGIAGSGQIKAKSYYWCAKALYELGRYELSYSQIKKAEMLYHDPSIRLLKSMVDAKLKEDKGKEKEICARMLNSKITA